MDEEGVPAVSLAVVEDMELSWRRAYGKIALNSRDEVTEDTQFQIQSVTKLFTAIAALRLVESEVVSLDEDVNRFLESWRIPDSDFALKAPVTLRRLLNHTAGFPTSNFGWEEGEEMTLRHVLDGEFPAKNTPARLHAVPGAQHEYSNLGYVVIQQLIEDVTGDSYEQAVSKLVLEPLSLNHTSIVPYPERFTIAKGHAGGNTLPISSHPCAFAQGSILSTPSDLAVLSADLLRSLRAGEGTLLSSESVHSMIDKTVPLGEALRQLLQGHADRQGLAVFVCGRSRDLVFSSLGGGDGYLSFLMLHPARGVALALLLNAQEGLPLAFDIVRNIAAAHDFDWGIQPVLPS